jgi:hypothetical protein
METTFLALAAPIIKQVAPSIANTIKNKISPSEIQQAILFKHWLNQGRALIMLDGVDNGYNYQIL